MVGQGVLRECLLDPGVQQVLAIGRNGTGQNHAKLRDLVKKDLLDFSDVEAQLSGYDACFFCLGVASTGMAEEQYTRITHDVPLAAAKTLLKQSPGMTFILVSGAGADSTERGRTMWAQKIPEVHHNHPPNWKSHAHVNAQRWLQARPGER